MLSQIDKAVATIRQHTLLAIQVGNLRFGGGDAFQPGLIVTQEFVLCCNNTCLAWIYYKPGSGQSAGRAET
jgi:hypothetical protein